MKTKQNTSSGKRTIIAPSGIVLFIVILFWIIGGQKSFAQGVGISEVAIPDPHPSSILELRSSLRGFLAPRMTGLQRDGIVAPATGLIIFNTTTNKLNIYNGTLWVALFSGSSGVNSVSGTADRISISGTSDLNVDIAGTYLGQTSITTLGTIGTGTWNGGIISGQYGGTGVANTGNTITIGGNFTTLGAFATTLTTTGITSVTLPVSGTLATLGGAETFTNKTLTTPVINGTITGTTVIPIANGGTGSATQNFVDLTTIQTAAGAKTWSALGTFNLGLTALGAAVTLNNDSNNPTNINTGTSTGTVTIGGTGIQTLNLGTGGSGSKTINIGTGAVSNSISIGTVTGTSSLTLRAGSGNIIVPNAVMLDISQVNNSSPSEGLKLPQSTDNSSATSEGQIGWDIDNNVLTVGTGAIARNIGIPNGMAVFTTDNPNWAHPVGVKFVWVKVWGGGGGGGTASGNNGDGGGGGSAYSEGLVDVSDAVTHDIIVGAAGAANGGNGGLSSFTALAMTVSAGGGSGTTSRFGGLGGLISGTGTIQFPGAKGGDGDNQDGAGGGSGGGSPFGGAGGDGGPGSNVPNPSAAGTTGTFPGGGGGGGSENAGIGAVGAGGLVIVYW